LEKENSEFIKNYFSLNENKIKCEKDYYEMRDNLMQKQNEINKLIEEKKSLEKKFKNSKDLQKINEDLKKAQDNLTAQIEKLEKEKIKFEKEKEALEERVKKLEEERLINEKNNKEKMNEFEKEKNNIVKEKNSIEKEKNNIEKEKNDVEKENQILKERIKKLEEDRLTTDNGNAKEVNKLKKENNDLRVEIEKQKKNESNQYKIFERKVKILNDISEKIIVDSVEEKFKEVLNKNKKNILGKVETILKQNKNFLDKIDNWKKKALDESISIFINETKHINVILLGKTGVGKSALVNVLVGKIVAPESGFRPETRGNSDYEAGILRLWDTEGIEANKNVDAQKILNNAKKLIKDSEHKGPDLFIHCIWYCLTGTRLEETEEWAIRELAKSYVDDKLPIIIVYTRALDPEAVQNIKDGIDITFKDRKMEYTSILARDVKEPGTGKILFQNFGVKNLIKITMDKYKNSIDSMSYHFVLNKTKETVKNKIKNKKGNNNLNSENIGNSICKFYEKLLDKLDNQTIELIKEGLENILNSCKNDIDFSENISNYINAKKKELFQDCNVNNEFKMSIIESLKNVILSKYENAKKKYIDNKLNEQIFICYVSIIEEVAESLVTDSLNKLKDELIPRMQKEIENSPNFKSMFAKFNSNNCNDINDSVSANSHQRKKVLPPIQNKK